MTHTSNPTFLTVALMLLTPVIAVAKPYLMSLETQGTTPTPSFADGSARVIEINVGSGLQVASGSAPNQLTLTSWGDNGSAIARILQNNCYVEFACAFDPNVTQINAIEINYQRLDLKTPTKLLLLNGPFTSALTSDNIIGEMGLGKPVEKMSSKKITLSQPALTDPDTGIWRFRLYPKGRSKEATNHDIPSQGIILQSIRFDCTTNGNSKIASPKAPKQAATPKPKKSKGSSTITLDMGRQLIDGILQPSGEIVGDAKLVSADTGIGLEYASVNPGARNWGSEKIAPLLETVAYLKWSKNVDDQYVDQKDALQNDVYFELGLEFAENVNTIKGMTIEGARRAEGTPSELSVIAYRPGQTTELKFNGAPILNPEKGPFSKSISGFSSIDLNDGRTIIFRFYNSGYTTDFTGKGPALFIDKIHFQTK
jgi:hypothetical protein